MRRAILLAALAVPLAGCANTHKGRAVQLVMASDAIADEIAQGWEVGVGAQIVHCQNTLGEESTSEQRADCMGIFGKGEALEAATQALVTTQIAIQEAVKCEELKTCPQKVDWQALKTTMLETWNTLRPYYDSIAKKGN
jgi:hypothetical protein